MSYDYNTFNETLFKLSRAPEQRTPSTLSTTQNSETPNPENPTAPTLNLKPCKVNNLVKKKGDSDEKLRSLTVVSSEMAKCRHPVLFEGGGREGERVWVLSLHLGFRVLMLHSRLIIL